MLKDDDGHIVSIASSAGFTGMPGMVDYCARYVYSIAHMKSYEAISFRNVTQKRKKS